VVKPVMEKISLIIEKECQMSGHSVEEIYLCGGTSAFNKIEKVIADRTGLSVVKADYPWLVTPAGIALACREAILNGYQGND